MIAAALSWIQTARGVDQELLFSVSTYFFLLGCVMALSWISFRCCPSNAASLPVYSPRCSRAPAIKGRGPSPTFPNARFHFA